MLLVQALLVIWSFLVPGVALAWCANPAWAWPLRLLVGFTLGALVVPLASFSAAWVLHQSVTTPLVVSTATLVALPAAAGAWLRARRIRS